MDGTPGIATGYTLNDRGSVPGGVAVNFFFDIASRPVLGPTQPHVQW